AGRYPHARNIDLFWDQLVAGHDAITVIPQERWNWEQYFDSRPGIAGKGYGKWGGFIEDVDQFDPFFFNISPHDAERMDPQERLFLQTAFEALGNAGYSRRDFLGQSDRKDVGVYVGVMWSDYHLLGSSETQREWADSWV